MALWLYAGPSVTLRAWPTWVCVRPRDSLRSLKTLANSLISSKLIPSTTLLVASLIVGWSVIKIHSIPITNKKAIKNYCKSSVLKSLSFRSKINLISCWINSKWISNDPSIWKLWTNILNLISNFFAYWRHLRRPCPIGCNKIIELLIIQIASWANCGNT